MTTLSSTPARSKALWSICAVIALLLGPLLTAGPAHAAAASASVTASVSSAGVTYGRPIAMTGSARTAAGPIVNAEVRIVGVTTSSEWRVLAQTRTDSSGVYRVSFRPLEQYRLRAELAATATTRAASSTSHTVIVQPGLYSPMPSQSGYAVAGRDKHASGALHGQLAGRRVKLEQLSGGVWRTVAQTYALRDGTFALAFRPATAGTTRLRIVVPSGQGLAAKAGPVTVLTTVAATAHLASRFPACYGVASTLAPTCVNPQLAGLILPTTDAGDLFLNTGGSYGKDCWQSNPTEDLKVCTIGSTRSDATRIAFVGDSHAAGYLAGLRSRLAGENWRVDTYLGVSCRWMDFPEGHGCEPRARSIEADLLTGRYDAIVVTGLRQVDANAETAEAVSQQYVRAWSRATAAGIPVIAVGDFPYLPRTALACVTGSTGLAGSSCTVPRGQALLGIDPMYSAARQTPGASFIDMNRYYCGPETCPLVSGGVVVFRDHHHITGTFSETIGPHVTYRVKRQLQALGVL